ncbi:MAG: GerMN domain-containing protein, partial [bacterium]
AKTVATAEASIESLLDGPTADEANSVPAVTTQIPAETELHSIDIDDDLATVDFSGEFGAEEGTVSASMRVAQVVFTLTRFSTIDSVQFRQDGQAVDVRVDNGAIVSGPVDRSDFLDFQAAISVETPTYGGPAPDPLRVTGMAAVFEATFQFALTDADGVIIEEGTAMSTSGVGWGSFDFTIDYDVDRTQRGALIVWTDSARDGSQIDVREYPVFLQP